MPLSAAICFLALSAGTLCARPERGLMRIVASETSGGFLIRWLPAAVFGVPLLFGWLTMAGQRAGFYSLEFGISVFVILNTVFFSMLVLWTATSLDPIPTTAAPSPKKNCACVPCSRRRWPT